MRNIYLDMKTIEEAKKILFSSFESFKITKTEKIFSSESLGRVLSSPVFASMSLPHFNSAAMDGIAVLAKKTFSASEINPKKLILGKDAYYVNTGQIIPYGTDSVIMIENVQEVNETEFIIEKPSYPWQNVRKIGEDIVSTELLFTRNHKITPYCIGALISSGVLKVYVKKKPKVLIIPTGSELVDWRKIGDNNLKDGKIFESNSYILENIIRVLGAKSTRHYCVSDKLDVIENVILEASMTDVDIILTIGGSSSGSKDYLFSVIKKIGKVLVHGVTMMPGKPVIIGSVNSKPFFGIPGYPISSIISFEEFVQPLICYMLSVSDLKRDKISVIVSRNISSKLGIEEFLRVKVGKIKDNFVAIPLSRGAGSITSITEADAIIRIPTYSEGIMYKQKVTAELLNPKSEIKKNILVVGSHDNTLNILSDELKIKNSNFSMTFSHVGSLGGIMAAKNNLCHLSGSHLLDEKSGIYNESYVKKYLYEIDIAIINLVMREQGIMISKGNPKNIFGLRDLGRKDILFVNRQKGSGTRILLDYKLREIGMSCDHIRGYNREEFTHMDVALAVLKGNADFGIGIYAAANIFGLDFIPVVTEKYDLILRENFLYSEYMKLLVNLIKSKSFKNRIAKMGGYNTEKAGEITILKANKCER